MPSCPSFIRELCQTLTGRWEPDRPLMMFTAYIDESDTHGPEPDMHMLANLAAARNWELFERGFRGLKREFGFRILHAVELRTETGNFRGWPLQKHQALNLALGELLEDNLTESFSVTCEYRVYKKSFLDVRPRKMHATSQYGVCFEALMFGAVHKLMEKPRLNPRLSVVVEDGHDNAPDTARIFTEMKADFLRKGVDILRTHTLASKEESDPLMAADYFAYGSARRERDVRSGKILRKPVAEAFPSKDEVGHTHMEISPEYLAMQIDAFNKRKADAHAEYLKRRETWQALQAKPK